MQDYGAFVKFFLQNPETNEKIEQKGLIHISEIQSGYVKSIHDIAKIGQKIMAQIIDIDEYNGKISLSIRSLEKIHKFIISTEKNILLIHETRLALKPLLTLYLVGLKKMRPILKQKKNAQSEDFL